MANSIDGVVLGADDFVQRRSQARLEVFLARAEHPLDQHALVATREQVGALGREAQAEHGQSMPVQYVHGRLDVGLVH